MRKSKKRNGLRNLYVSNEYFDVEVLDLKKLLMETLIIECYESQKRENDIRDSNGQYFMLDDLIGKTLAPNGLKLGREAKNSLRPIKKLGDLSAHTRRYNARKSDLDKVSKDIRLVVEELVNLSNIKR